MPITFVMNRADRYFESLYLGPITDADLLDYWKEFLNSGDWIPGANELADLSRADVSQVTAEGIRALADYTGHMYRKHGIESNKAAIFAPHALPFGLSRMYEAFTEESPENVMVFQDRAKALQWLLKAKKSKG